MLTTENPNNAVIEYLNAARKFHSQASIAKQLGVDARTVRRWETNQTQPPAYLSAALQQMLPFHSAQRTKAKFDFIDLFAGIGGIRAGFEAISGQCVFSSEWDGYSQKTYSENFPSTHLLAGDITQIAAKDIPDHDVLLAGFPCQPFSKAGVSKKMH